MDVLRCCEGAALMHARSFLPAQACWGALQCLESSMSSRGASAEHHGDPFREQQRGDCEGAVLA